MKTILLFTLIALCVQNTVSQVTSVVPSSASVAGAEVADYSLYSAFANPASLTSFTRPAMGIGYEQRFGLQALASKSVFVAFPSQLLHTAVNSSFFGNQSYNEWLMAIVLARNFGPLHLGVQFNYLSVYFGESNRRFGLLIPQIGAQVELSESVIVGFSTFNPTQLQLKSEQSVKTISSIFAMGFRWNASDNFKTLVQLDKILDGNYRIAGGFDYCIKNFLSVSSGLEYNEYLVPELGVGLHYRWFSFRLRTSLHPLFGISNSAFVSLSLVDSKK